MTGGVRRDLSPHTPAFAMPVFSHDEKSEIGTPMVVALQRIEIEKNFKYNKKNHALGFGDWRVWDWIGLLLFWCLDWIGLLLFNFGVWMAFCLGLDWSSCFFLLLNWCIGEIKLV
jgi:hypothetical protein